MNNDLIITLQNYWFSEKEAKVYLTTLELWNTIASTIARRSEINRATTYSILNDFKKRGIANEVTKDDVKYFSVIKPEILLKNLEEKYKNFKDKMPDFLSLYGNFWNRPKIKFFEWFEWLKEIFKEIVYSWKERNEKPFLSFLWVNKMDKRFEEWIKNDFTRIRKDIKTEKRVILSVDKTKNNEEENYYIKFNKDKHNVVEIDKNILSFSNELMLYWKNSVAIILHEEWEMSWVTIESKTLHDWLESLFNVMREWYKNKK